MAVQTAPTISIDPDYLRTKRALDILFILLFSIPILIVFGIIALLIKLDSKGPVLHIQKRMGQNGVEFSMLKFRSMFENSDDKAHREAVKQYMNGERLNGDADAPYKLKNDARVTRVGRFIRKTSLDELPQFWNVLRGEMTLVGPRPPLTYEVEEYSPRDWLRLAGKPGLTGTWQVYGRSRVRFQSMVAMDIDYLQQQSIREDLKLIVLTVSVMLRGRGGA